MDIAIDIIRTIFVLSDINTIVCLADTCKKFREVGVQLSFSYLKQCYPVALGNKDIKWPLIALKRVAILLKYRPSIVSFKEADLISKFSEYVAKLSCSFDTSMFLFANLACVHSILEYLNGLDHIAMEFISNYGQRNYSFSFRRWRRITLLPFTNESNQELEDSLPFNPYGLMIMDCKDIELVAMNIDRNADRCSQVWLVNCNDLQLYESAYMKRLVAGAINRSQWFSSVNS